MAPRDPPKIDRYEVLGQLGKGSNGIVYLARDPRVGREVAIKVINPARVKETVVQQRFHREARAIARLHHPNIMQLLDYSGPNARIPYLVVERLQGKNLDDVLIERGHPLEPALAAAVVHEICLALQHAHAHSIVHRDLKPENIFIEPEGRIVLCDFGIARSFSDEENGTLAGHNTRLAGSPLYMSPEQVTSPQTVGAQSDMFALGSVLHFLLTLQHAFMAESVVNVLKRIVAATPDPLREKRPGLPDRIYRVLEKLHQKAPEKRYSSSGAIADSLLLVMKEDGHSDPRRALKQMLQTLGRASSSNAKKVVTGVDQMDEEAKTMVTSLAPRPAEVRPVVLDETTTAAGKKDVTLPGAKPLRRAQAPKQPVLLAGGILTLAMAASIFFVVSSFHPEPKLPALPPPVPPPAATTGTLRLAVQPTADVYVDDRMLGSSADLGPTPLPPGPHRLRVMHAKLGRFEQSFDIRAGLDTVLTVDLRKK